MRKVFTVSIKIDCPSLVKQAEESKQQNTRVTFLCMTVISSEDLDWRVQISKIGLKWLKPKVQVCRYLSTFTTICFLLSTFCRQLRRWKEMQVKRSVLPGFIVFSSSSPMNSSSKPCGSFLSVKKSDIRLNSMWKNSSEISSAECSCNTFIIELSAIE